VQLNSLQNVQVVPNMNKYCGSCPPVTYELPIQKQKDVKRKTKFDLDVSQGRSSDVKNRHRMTRIWHESLCLRLEDCALTGRLTCVGSLHPLHTGRMQWERNGTDITLYYITLHCGFLTWP